MNTKTYDHYRINRNVYNELKWLCRQYKDICREIADCYGISAVTYDGSGAARASGSTRASGATKGNRIGDPTQERSDRAMRLRADIEMIDRALEQTAAEPMRRYIKKAVTEGLPYEYLGNVPCGRRLFYELRMKFFWNLAVLKKG